MAPFSVTTHDIDYSLSMEVILSGCSIRLSGRDAAEM